MKLTASYKLFGKLSIPASSLSLSLIAKILATVSGSTSKLFLIPSKPACNNTANTKYGFALGSGHLSSTLVPAPLEAGTLINAVLLLQDQAK